MSAVYEELRSYVGTLSIVDTHEHLPGREALREKETDVLQEYLSHYFSSDLLAMGLKKEELYYVRDSRKPLMERWNFVEPYWELARNTSYGRALDLAARDIYGIDRIDRSTLEELNTRFLKTLEPDAQHYKRVLKELSNIEYSILDTDLDCDPVYFKSAYNVWNLIVPESWDMIEQMAATAGIAVTSLEDWQEVCRFYLEDALNRGAAALKCNLAYVRDLRFEPVTRQDAEAAFLQLLPKKGRAIWEEGRFDCPRPLQNYMMHFLLRIANQKGLVLQFHTGLQEGTGNYLVHSEPTQLANLFIQYPNVTFDLFHIGFPYQHVMSALAKLHPNVYLDMCWAHIISETASVRSLSEWLDSVPVGKILAFGGDYSLVDGVYAHQLMARRNVCKALTEKVEAGAFDLDAAKWMAKRMLCDNPKALFESK